MYILNKNTKCGGDELDKKRIARNLINLRAGKSREEVADNLGISLSALQMYENAQRIPKDEIKKRISIYYKKTVDEIFFK